MFNRHCCGKNTSFLRRPRKLSLYLVVRRSVEFDVEHLWGGTLDHPGWLPDNGSDYVADLRRTSVSSAHVRDASTEQRRRSSIKNLFSPVDSWSVTSSSQRLTYDEIDERSYSERDLEATAGGDVSIVQARSLARCFCRRYATPRETFATNNSLLTAALQPQQRVSEWVSSLLMAHQHIKVIQCHKRFYSASA